MKKFPILFLLLLLPAPVLAQGMDGMAMDHHAGTETPQDAPGMAMTGALGAYGMSREASGTSWQPEAAPILGIMQMWDDWMVMLQGRVSGLINSQSGPRGDSMAYESGMGMVMATRALTDKDMLGLRLMVSLDPFIGRRGYPLLLASGETADGVNHLVDRQHPHDLLMEIAGTYSHSFSDSDSFFVYVGDPGEPALGPSAYMHRLSGQDSPATPISHHWLDSTHVTFGVATIGWVHDGWKLEASRFTGREPDQHRFNFDAMTFDSTSVRLSFNPDDNWSLQVSQGFLKSPEALDPDINENRVTASATYYREFDFGSLAATIAWGSKRLSDGVQESGGLIEAEFKPDDAWTLMARAETIGSDELVPGPNVRSAGEVSLGVIRDWQVADHLKLGLGGLYSFDFPPSSPGAPYGDDPHGAMLFLRLLAQ